MIQGLHLFTWPDWYYLDIELQKRQQHFAEKYGAGNIVRFSEDTITLPAIHESLQGGWLFSSKKLIICKWIPDDKSWSWKVWAAISGFFENLFSRGSSPLPEDVIMVFVSLDPDKRLRLYKILSEHATIKSFPTPNEGNIHTFLQQKLDKYYTKDLWDFLIAYVWNNLFRLESEANKIYTYMQYNNLSTLSLEDRDAIVYTPIQTDAFGVLDGILEGNMSKTMALIDRSSASMTPWPEFIGLMYRWIKHMILTAEIYNTWIKWAKEIWAEIWMHFFPIAKNLKYISQLQKNSAALQKIFHDVLLLDKEIKSWTFPQEWFWSAIKGIIHQNLTVSTA